MRTWSHSDLAECLAAWAAMETDIRKAYLYASPRRGALALPSGVNVAVETAVRPWAGGTASLGDRRANWESEISQITGLRSTVADADGLRPQLLDCSFVFFQRRGGAGH